MLHTGKQNPNDANWDPTGKEYKLQLDHLALLVRRPIVTEKYFAHHQRMLKSHKAIYPYTRTLVNWTQINRDVSTFFTNELFPGRSALPVKCFTLFQLQDRTLGSLEKNFLKMDRPQYLQSVGFYLDSK